MGEAQGRGFFIQVGRPGAKPNLVGRDHNVEAVMERKISLDIHFGVEGI